MKVPHFAMVNLIAGKEIVSELVQQDFTVEKVVGRLGEILSDGPARTRMIDSLNDVRARLAAELAAGLSAELWKAAFTRWIGRRKRFWR